MHVYAPLPHVFKLVMFGNVTVSKFHVSDIGGARSLGLQGCRPESSHLKREIVLVTISHPKAEK